MFNRKEYSRKYYLKNRKKILKRNRIYYWQIGGKKAYLKKYHQEHLQKIKEYRKNRGERDSGLNKKWCQGLYLQFGIFIGALTLLTILSSLFPVER